MYTEAITKPVTKPKTPSGTDCTASNNPHKIYNYYLNTHYNVYIKIIIFGVETLNKTPFHCKVGRQQIIE